jgi:hypothetical protein
MNGETSVISLSVKDLFSAKMLKYSILPFVISTLIAYVFFFLLAGAGLDQFGAMDLASTQTTVQNGIPHTESFATTLEGAAIIKFLMSSAITSWIASFLVYTIGGFLMLYFSIFIALIVIGFLTPAILGEIQRRHYPDLKMVGHSNVFEALFLTLKWTLTMIILFFVLILIPVLNIIAFNLPLYYFFHKMMTYDVGSAICSRDENLKIKFFNASALRLKTLGLYLISLIPFVIFFASVFYVIYLGHSYFLEVRKLRAA